MSQTLLTTEEILQSLYLQRQAFITSGKFFQKSWTAKDGETIFLRSPEEIDDIILYWENKLAKEQGKSSRLKVVSLNG